MECYEGATMIKTYRGMLANDTEDQIRLKTPKGAIGYRIVKFEVINQNPTTENVECVLQITKISSSPSLLIDLSDGDILAVVHYAGSEDSNVNPVTKTIIMDQEIFNQDIYITQIGQGSNTDNMNYYLELEQVMLNENESTMATLQSLRRFALPRN